MTTRRPSNEERRTWNNLDSSIKRNRELSEDLDKWIKSHDRTPPKPPLFDTDKPKDDGCLMALLPLLFAVGVLALRTIA
jgi:hypothetical protein